MSNEPKCTLSTQITLWACSENMLGQSIEEEEEHILTYLKLEQKN